MFDIIRQLEERRARARAGGGKKRVDPNMREEN